MADRVRVAVLGAASLRCGPAIGASLAQYFGERPLEFCYWDADAEILEVMVYVARHCLYAMRSPHSVISEEAPADALAKADGVIFAMDRRSAAKFLREPESDNGVERALQRLSVLLSPEPKYLSLIPEPVPSGLTRLTTVDWPPPLPEDAPLKLPLRLLRILNSEDPIHELLRGHERTPLSEWLESLA